MNNRPDFTLWLRNQEEPDDSWRPHALRGSVGMFGTGELVDWVGQGFGGVNTTELLAAIEASCARRHYNSHTVLILCYKSDKLDEPYTVHNNYLFHPSSDEDQITIHFAPIREGI